MTVYLLLSYEFIIFFSIIHDQLHRIVVENKVIKDIVIKFLVHHNKNNIFQRSSFTAALTSMDIPYLRHTTMV